MEESMKAAKSDADLEKELSRGERMRARKKSLNILVILYWLLLAIAGTTVAVCLGLARNDWVFWASDISPDGQATASSVGLVAACVGAGICGVFGLIVMLLKRQLVIGLTSMALGGSFLYFFIGPTWLPFAAGLGALFLGIIVLWLGDRKEKRGAKKAA
jgi:hypothetical protein